VIESEGAVGSIMFHIEGSLDQAVDIVIGCVARCPRGQIVSPDRGIIFLFSMLSISVVGPK
jgi:hypothetical protein